MVISIDAMGGDRGAVSVVGGMDLSARANPDIRFIVHGDKATLINLIAKHKHLTNRCVIRHTPEVVGMEDKPSQVLRNGKETSMWSTIEAVRNAEAAVAVSCGNTGALMAISMIRLRKAPGVYRPAIGILWPSDSPQGFNIVLDVGADVRADAKDLLQYSLMGASYARNGLSLTTPRIGLLNVGTEEHKGRAELKEAFDLIQEAAEENNFEFVGFVEGGDIPRDKADVIVTDGFTGNVALKTAEGTASFVSGRLRNAFRRSIFARLGGLLALHSIQTMRTSIDPRNVNGGVFLGLNGTVIKSHGDADAKGVSAAIRLAFQLAQLGFSEKLAARVASGSTSGHGDKQKQGK